MLLPFVTQPKKAELYTIGNENIGVLEVPKLGDLSPNERRYISELSKNLPNLQRKAVEISEAIAQKTGESVTAIYQKFIDAATDTSGDAAKFLEDYVGEILEFRDIMGSRYVDYRLIQATAIIRFRLQPEKSDVVRQIDQAVSVVEKGLKRSSLSQFEINRLVNDVRRDLESNLDVWGLQHTGDASLIHPDLVSLIADFAEREDARWAESSEPEEQPEGQEVTEEDLKKSRKGRKKSTGEISTGDASDTGQMTPDSTTETSDSSQPG